MVGDEGGDARLQAPGLLGVELVPSGPVGGPPGGLYAPLRLPPRLFFGPLALGSPALGVAAGNKGVDLVLHGLAAGYISAQPGPDRGAPFGYQPIHPFSNIS